MTNSAELNKTAVTAAPILPILAERWSPRSFDESYALTEQEVLSILEAARWAPSANNAQPWRFSVLHRGSELFNSAVEQGLTGWNQAWAPKASALVILSVVFKNAEGKENPWVDYDAGLAAANLTAQATALGL
ncbi:MAG: nitroreductase family protein, partial [Micrococcales bacterium]